MNIPSTCERKEEKSQRCSVSVYLHLGKVMGIKNDERTEDEGLLSKEMIITLTWRVWGRGGCTGKDI